jgi:alkanesulfonate monooxygenase SsuD/methylene tetrahydromethanopterin reductase-like flavin-dependent oxidoreductase (luciferase family)
MYSPERYGQALSTVARHALAAGRDPGLITPALFAFVALARSREEGQAVAVAHLERLYGVPLLEAVRHCVPCGTPADCVAMLARFVAAGARHLVLSPICPAGELWEHLRLLAGEVAPRLREAVRSLEGGLPLLEEGR